MTSIIVILAAGSSSRMRGEDKLLQVIEGEALLRRQVRCAIATGRCVIVTLPPDRPAREAELDGLDAVRVTVADAASGMSASLRAGVAAAAALPGAASAGLMILPADMPDFTAADLAAMMAAFDAHPDRIWRGATADGRQGHPAIFPADLWPALAKVSGDQGGIGVIRANADRVSLFSFPGDAAITDLDTPEDWAAWRARRI